MEKKNEKNSFQDEQIKEIKESIKSIEAHIDIINSEMGDIKVSLATLKGKMAYLPFITGMVGLLGGQLVSYLLR